MSSGIIETIKQVAINAYEASKPVKLLFGRVISKNPLKIKVDDKMTLTREFLITNGELNEDDSVTLIRCQGGQRYVVLGTRTVQIKTDVTPGGEVTIDTGDWQYPFEGGYTKTSNFGIRRRNGKDEYHKGVDLVGKNKNIHPVNNGTVVWTKKSNVGYGNHILINHGDGIWSLYAHLSMIFVEKNQLVNKNTILGVEGSTGDSTGSHLHLEIRKSENGSQVDPISFLNSN